MPKKERNIELGTLSTADKKTHEEFVAKEVDNVKAEWTDLLKNLRNPRVECQFRGVTPAGSSVDLGVVINDFFHNVFDKIDNATSMGKLRLILGTGGDEESIDNETHSAEFFSQSCQRFSSRREGVPFVNCVNSVAASLRNPVIPFDRDAKEFLCVNSVVASLFTGVGFLLAHIGQPLGMAIACWYVGAMWQGMALKPLVHSMLSRSMNTWRENFIGGLDTMQTVYTDAVAAINNERARLVRAPIRKTARREQWFDKFNVGSLFSCGTRGELKEEEEEYMQYQLSLSDGHIPNYNPSLGSSSTET